MLGWLNTWNGIIMWIQSGDTGADIYSQKAVSAYYTSKQILPFGVARQSSLHARETGLKELMMKTRRSAE